MKMKKRQMKARLRDLEELLDRTQNRAGELLDQLDNANFALDEIQRICRVIVSRAVEQDARAVGDFAWITTTTPTLNLLADKAAAALADKAAAALADKGVDQL